MKKSADSSPENEKSASRRLRLIPVSEAIALREKRLKSFIFGFLVLLSIEYFDFDDIFSTRSGIYSRFNTTVVGACAT